MTKYMNDNKFSDINSAQPVVGKFNPVALSDALNTGYSIAKSKAFVFVDLETTGLDLVKHGIIQVGAYATGASENVRLGYFVEDANPFIDEDGNTTPISFSQESLDVNGYTFEDIDAADALNNVLMRFDVWCMRLSEKYDLTLVYHNAKFDHPRLELAYQRAGLSEPTWFRRVLCTVSLGFAKYGEVLSLKKLAEKLNIYNGDAHDALNDAMTTASVFHKLNVREATIIQHIPPNLPYIPAPPPTTLPQVYGIPGINGTDAQDGTLWALKDGKVPSSVQS